MEFVVVDMTEIEEMIRPELFTLGGETNCDKTEAVIPCPED
jgi:hypothetical protein